MYKNNHHIKKHNLNNMPFPKIKIQPYQREANTKQGVVWKFDDSLYVRVIIYPAKLEGSCIQPIKFCWKLRYNRSSFPNTAKEDTVKTD